MGSSESQYIRPREQQYAGRSLAVLHVSQLGGALDDWACQTGCCRRFVQIEDVVEATARRFRGRVEAGVAAELETEVFLVDPDLATVVTGKVGPGVEMVKRAADPTERLHVGFDDE
ncbi:hypothetical protein [Candidatus Amarobacter glycogenicus]|uniref:hypothetical protein n=1 Tax=Candidatus Amarobacter glycogenicus TaxID=3140699 RepID=UPI0031366651|nr:hypothetical protein [Dehalococcoidia bacterium]